MVSKAHYKVRIRKKTYSLILLTKSLLDMKDGVTENVKFLKNQDLSKSLNESLRRLGDSPCISKTQMIQDYQLYMYCMQYSFNVKRQPKNLSMIISRA